MVNRSVGSRSAGTMSSAGELWGQSVARGCWPKCGGLAHRPGLLVAASVARMLAERGE
jgi:hypothetical protein